MGKHSESWDSVDIPQREESYYKSFDRHQFQEGEWDTIRLLGQIVRLQLHWIPVKGKTGKTTSYPVLCRKNGGEEKHCILCDVLGMPGTVVLSNAIIRDKQESPPIKSKRIPPKGAEYRCMGDKWWSPIEVIQFPTGAAQRVKNQGSLNKVRGKDGKIRAMNMAHPKYGRDLMILYDPTAQGAAMYDIQRGDRTPLSKTEKLYLLYDLEKVFDYIPENKSILEALQKAYDQEVVDEENCKMDLLRKYVSGKVNLKGKKTKSDKKKDEKKEKKSKKTKKEKKDKKKDKKIKPDKKKDKKKTKDKDKKKNKKKSGKSKNPFPLEEDGFDDIPF